MRGLNSEKSSNCRRIITHENLVFSHWCMSGLKFTLFLLHFFLVNFSYLSPDKYADYLLTCVWFTSLYKSLLNDKLSLLLERPVLVCGYLQMLLHTRLFYYFFSSVDWKEGRRNIFATQLAPITGLVFYHPCNWSKISCQTDFSVHTFVSVFIFLIRSKLGCQRFTHVPCVHSWSISRFTASVCWHLRLCVLQLLLQCHIFLDAHSNRL